MNNNDDEPVTKKQFDFFLRQHFWHLKKDVTFIKGQLYVLIPLVIGVLAVMLTVLLTNIL